MGRIQHDGVAVQRPLGRRLRGSAAAGFCIWLKQLPSPARQIKTAALGCMVFKDVRGSLSFV
jgi:hypothetical protein